MFARVAPLRRVPKALEVCDYKIPEEFLSTLQTGQLIRIPFRRSSIFGIVLGIEKNSEFARQAKPIDSIVHETPLLRPETIDLFGTLSDLYHVPLGTLLESSLPPLQKRKITTLRVTPFAKILPKKTRTPTRFVQYHTISEQQAFFQKQNTHQTLVLVPEIQQGTALFEMMTKKQQETTVLWHSELTQKQKFETWEQIRNGVVQMVIGTRSAVFLPFFSLEHIILESEEDRGHKHEEGYPRFHVKDVVQLLSSLYTIPVTLTSSHPSSETYYHIYKKNYHIESKIPITQKTLNLITPFDKPSPTLIDLKSEWIGHKEDHFVSKRAEAEIQNSKKNIFFFLNRRGTATSISCYECGYRDRCPECELPRVYHEKDKSLHCHVCKTQVPVPLLCPKCQTRLLQLKGYGTEYLERVLSQMVPKEISIVRLDSDQETSVIQKSLHTPGRKLFIGTELSFQYLNWKDIDRIVCINMDMFLSQPDFSTEEKLWHTLQKIQFLRDQKSEWYIQTNNPDHPFWRGVHDWDYFYRQDLKTRKDFFSPPYSFLVKYLVSDTKKQKAKEAAQKLKAQISYLLTNSSKNSIIYNPIELHPHFYRKKYWYGVVILLEPDLVPKIILEINKKLNGSVNIDPRPNSILSP